MSPSCTWFRTNNQCDGVANACRGALPIWWIKFLLGNKYLMHWDQMLKYSFTVTEQPNVDAKCRCELVFIFFLYVLYFLYVFPGVRQRTQYYIRSSFQTGFSFSLLSSLSTGQIIPSALLLWRKITQESFSKLNFVKSQISQNDNLDDLALDFNFFLHRIWKAFRVSK